MATRVFSLNTEPHVADVGGTELRFLAEVMGDEFLDAYAEMRKVQQEESGVDIDELSAGSVESLRLVVGGLRVFLSRLMLPESAELVTAVEVARDGEVLETFGTWGEAAAYAEEHPGARPRWKFRVPDRVLLELMGWAIELYAGGKRPPTSSGGSARPSPRGGKRGTASSRSKG
ncbi:hypothetical protein [Streptomyces bacillaris]|uniref:hypothetical protein n=1 Tax=Streptomyces bacillaris TaxID=68179 RepID=UPI0036255AA9